MREGETEAQSGAKLLQQKMSKVRLWSPYLGISVRGLIFRVLQRLFTPEAWCILLHWGDIQLGSQKSSLV